MMNYEQEKHKIRTIYNKNKELKNDIKHINYSGEKYPSGNSIKRIIYLESAWENII